jgi:dolichyl-phosphate-mannose-protein mannosyltransferase
MKAELERDRSRREWLAVAALAAVGFGLRCWPIGRLGLTHFDEGIYALAAGWSLQPKGLASISPTLIPYAPPGYPILGGLAYVLLGRTDGAMIAVSQLAGTLTIPVVAWLGRRTFGPGCGFAAATFCAFSGPHIAFSRMALTDASFLLAWLVALGMGMRFLERPGWLRAIFLGMAVGLAQEFKYNGWLTGGIVVVSAAWGILVRPEGRKAGSIFKTFGWGALAAGMAWLVVWPWYAFVEAHGGYPALLRHQQSYLGGFGDWWPNLLIQADQAVVLSGGEQLILPGLLFACASPWIARSPARVATMARLPSVIWSVIGFGLFFWYLAYTPYWLGLVMTPWLLTRLRISVRMVGIWWLVLSAMTPFYHPYARLWLPYHAANWLLLGCLFAERLPALIAHRSNLDRARQCSWRRRLRTLALLGLFALGAVVAVPRLRAGQDPKLPALLAPSDSLYLATVHVAALLPDEVKGLRLLVRPPVSYYLAARVALYPMASSDSLLQGGDPRAWALIDSAILSSETGGTSGGAGRNLLDRFANHWEVVEEFPTDPNLPTLLDLDPRAARSAPLDRSYPLWLLRPRTSKAPR